MSVINHIGISGGKDSTALLLWAVHESGYDPTTLRVTFCDTGNEHELTYAYIRLLSERVYPIEWIIPPLDFYALAKMKGRFPSAKVRFCTQELKMLPTQAYVLDLLRQGYQVLMHSGVRAAESAARAELLERDWDSYFACNIYRPLLHWDIEQVWAMHRRYGIPRNPLYDLGMSRVGCAPCIMSRKSEILRLSQIAPERIGFIRKMETSMGNRCGYSSFFARDKVPISQRSKQIMTKSGEVMRVATIDDVVRWSTTDRGGQQYRFDFDEEPPSCSHTYGACE